MLRGHLKGNVQVLHDGEHDLANKLSSNLQVLVDPHVDEGALGSIIDLTELIFFFLVSETKQRKQRSFIFFFLFLFGGAHEQDAVDTPDGVVCVLDDRRLVPLVAVLDDAVEV